MTDVAKLAEWFISGDTGVSSKTIVAFMMGADMKKVYGHPPCDPSDLGRCLRLLDKFPEFKARMPGMAAIDDQWARITPHWGEASALMVEEVGIDWSKGKSAPLTYKFMKSAGF